MGQFTRQQFTRRQILDLDNALVEIERIPAAARFTVWIARLRERAHDLVQEVRERGRVPEAVARVYADYESARIACARAHALKDGKGQPMSDATGQFVIADHTAFERAIGDLQQSERFREAFTAVQRQRAAWETWVTAPGDAWAWPTFPEAELPNTLTAALVRPLLLLLVSAPPPVEPAARGPAATGGSAPDRA